VNSSVFKGTLIQIKHFAIVIEFASVHSEQKWSLVSVYGCQGDLRDEFIQWLFKLIIPDEKLWFFMGDFNFIRSQENMSLLGGHVNDIFIFNELISNLGLLEGGSYTWSNMQQNRFPVELDWFFTTPNWTTVYPNTLVHPLSKSTSDHVPYVVTINIVIPQANIFHFKIIGWSSKAFMECVLAAWNLDCWGNNDVAILSKKLKMLRGALKQWKTGLSKLKQHIAR
jgi:hypothetical protein